MRARRRVDDAREQAAALVAGLLGAFDGLTAETLEGIEHARPAAMPAGPAVLKESAPRAGEDVPTAAPEEVKAPAKRKALARNGRAAARVSGARWKTSPLPPPLGELPQDGPGAAGHADGEAPRRAPRARKGGAAPNGGTRAGGAKKT